MDDVLLISSEPKELQLMLEITNAIAGKYHIEFGDEKSNVMKIGWNKNNPEFTLGDMNLKYTDKYKYLGIYTTTKQPWTPHQGPQRESRKRIPNPTSHSREQELQQHWNANNMGTKAMLHCMNHSIQQRNLESRENRTGKNQQDHGQHNKKNTNGTTEYPQGSAVHWNRVAGSRSNKTKKPSAHGAQANQRQQPANEKAHNKQHHNTKVGRRNVKSKRTTWNR